MKLAIPWGTVMVGSFGSLVCRNYSFLAVATWYEFAILLEPTVPLFFRWLETFLNTFHNLPAAILTEIIPLYQCIHIRQRGTHLQHQFPSQDFLFYGSMSDVDNCWKISN